MYLDFHVNQVQIYQLVCICMDPGQLVNRNWHHKANRGVTGSVPIPRTRLPGQFEHTTVPFNQRAPHKDTIFLFYFIILNRICQAIRHDR